MSLLCAVNGAFSVSLVADRGAQEVRLREPSCNVFVAYHSARNMTKKVVNVLLNLSSQ